MCAREFLSGKQKRLKTIQTTWKYGQDHSALPESMVRDNTNNLKGRSRLMRLDHNAGFPPSFSKMVFNFTETCVCAREEDSRTKHQVAEYVCLRVCVRAALFVWNRTLFEFSGVQFTVFPRRSIRSTDAGRGGSCGTWVHGRLRVRAMGEPGIHGRGNRVRSPPRSVPHFSQRIRRPPT